jgi:hypothetical protein
MKTGYDRIRGRFVIIHHPNRYLTHYYHLSRTGAGIRNGRPVIQGQVIGYVGRSGRVTGWHLHYGVQKNGRFINPLRLKSPSQNPVPGEFREDFMRRGTVLVFLLSDFHFPKIPESVQHLFWGEDHPAAVQPSEPGIIR